MKRFLFQLIPVLAAVAVLSLVCYLLWPHSFANLQPE